MWLTFELPSENQTRAAASLLPTGQVCDPSGVLAGVFLLGDSEERLHPWNEDLCCSDKGRAKALKDPFKSRDLLLFFLFCSLEMTRKLDKSVGKSGFSHVHCVWILEKPYLKEYLPYYNDNKISVFWTKQLIFLCLHRHRCAWIQNRKCNIQMVIFKTAFESEARNPQRLPLLLAKRLRWSPSRRITMRNPLHPPRCMDPSLPTP